MKSKKNELERIEKEIRDPDDVSISVNWRADDLIEWPCEDGSIELISQEEYKARGGVIIDWPDDPTIGGEM